jgi:hypothetical protein
MSQSSSAIPDPALWTTAENSGVGKQNVNNWRKDGLFKDGEVEQFEVVGRPGPSLQWHYLITAVRRLNERDRGQEKRAAWACGEVIQEGDETLLRHGAACRLLGISGGHGLYDRSVDRNKAPEIPAGYFGMEQRTVGGRTHMYWRQSELEAEKQRCQRLPTIADVERSGIWVCAKNSGVPGWEVSDWRRKGLFKESEMKRIEVRPTPDAGISETLWCYRKKAVDRLRKRRRLDVAEPPGCSTTSRGAPTGPSLPVLELVHRYPTARRLAQATADELADIPYLPHQRIDALLEHARTSVASPGR